MKECLDDILAVLVLYRRDLALTETFISLSRALTRSGSCLDLFVYDNSPAPMAGSEEGQYWRIHYLHDPTNPGVSKAYNAGFRLAEQLGKKWLLLLDQDTIFPENALAVYCQAVEEHADVALFAPLLLSDDTICSPCRYWARTGLHPKKIAVGTQLFHGKAVLNSGMLVRVDIFERCGGFNERIRLDFADFAFNNRLRQYCDKFCVLPMECNHGFSGVEAASLDDVLSRFELFREGAANSVEGFADAVLYRLVVLKRCLRLTLQFCSLRFIGALTKDKGSRN